MTLPTRKIGKDDVTAIGFGAMGLGGAYGPTGTDEERLKILDAVYARGCTNWDTADVYGDSEELLGKWFAKTGKRKEIFLATKFGLFKRPPERTVNAEPEYLKGQLEKSLKLLQTDYVDLFYLHRADKTVPIETTVAAMAELVAAGKVRYLGLSEVSADTLRRAHAVHPIAALQVEYSPFTLDIEDPRINILNTARELGVAIIAYSPLGRGLITGRYRSPDDLPEADFRRMVPRYSKENFPKILKLADGLKEIGQAHGATGGQVAIAWLLAQGDDIIPIPGTTQEKYLDENLGSLKLQLTPGELIKVREEAADADAASGGDRYPPGYAELSFGDTPPLGK